MNDQQLIDALRRLDRSEPADSVFAEALFARLQAEARPRGTGGLVLLVVAALLTVAIAGAALAAGGGLVDAPWRGRSPLEGEALTVATPTPATTPSPAVVQIPSQWHSDVAVAFRATVPAGAPELYWRAWTYDRFALGGWEQSVVTARVVDAGQPLLTGTAEDPSEDVTEAVRITVRPDDFGDDALLSPGRPTTVDERASVLLTGDDGWFAGVEIGGAAQYTIDARILRLGDDEVISESLLRGASEDYPDDVAALYTDVPEGAVGPDAADLLDRMVDLSPSRDPYDLAVTFRDYLLDDDSFTYTTDIRGLPCASHSAVECFARHKRGYCLHYASTLAILLRAANPDHPIPTRLVQGFLPGTRSGTEEIVENRQAHAWVEVYFPGYGWLPFDPTGGGVARPSVIR